MTVIVGEDQLSLAIGKKGQNVRLATRLVGWDIKIVSEEVLKKEIAQQMGRMIASGEAVPITELEGVTPSQADMLAEHGIEDIEKLAAASVDDLSEFLNVSMDEAETILSSARAIVAAKEDENGSGDAEVSSAAPLTETSSEEEMVPPAEAVTAEQGPANGDGAEDDGGPADANEAETVALISDDAGADGQEESAESPIASTSDDAGAGEQDDFTEPSTEETAA